MVSPLALSGDGKVTCICYRDGVLAADRWVICGDAIVGTTDKIVRTNKGVLIGAAGHSDLCEAFVSWASEFDFERFPIPRFPDGPRDGKGLTGLVVLPDGKVIEYTGEGRPIASIRDNFRAIGSAYDMAMAAMDAGASAVEAVEACSRRRVGIGGGVTVLYLDDWRQMAHQRATKPQAIDGASDGASAIARPFTHGLALMGSAAA